MQTDCIDSLGRFEETTLVATDHTALGATLFHPLAEAEATVIVHGATATPQSYYAKFARYLAASGVRVLTYDYRGIGRSRPETLRGYAATMSEWAKMDAVAAHRFVRERFGSAERVVLVGHSFGGQLLGLVDEALDTAGAVLVGSQLGYYGSWPLVPRVKLALAWRVVPQLTSLYGYLPGKVFGMREDLPRGVATEWARWCTHPDYFMADHGDARARFARFRGPLRFYNFTDDAYAPETAVRRLASCFDETKLERVVVAPRDHGGGRIGHFGFFRRRFRDSLWLDTVQFVKDVAGGTAVRPARYGVRETSVSRRRRKEPYVRIDEKDIRADLDAGRP